MPRLVHTHSSQPKLMPDYMSSLLFNVIPLNTSGSRLCRMSQLRHRRKTIIPIQFIFSQLRNTCIAEDVEEAEVDAPVEENLEESGVRHAGFY